MPRATLRSSLLAAVAIAACGGGADAMASTMLSGTLTADNAFFAYLGTSKTSLGTLVASGNNWGAGFSLSHALTAGATNYLNIEVINYGGPGGFDAVLNLIGSGFKFGNGAQTLTTNPGDFRGWLGSYNSSNSNVAVQPWVPATGTVSQALTYNWGNEGGTPNWLWPSDAASGGSYNTCQFCTIDLTVTITPTANVPEPAAWLVLLAGLGALGTLAALRRNT